MPLFLLTTRHFLLLLATSSLQHVSAKTDTSPSCGSVKHPRIFPNVKSRRGLIRYPRMLIFDGNEVEISDQPWMVQLEKCRKKNCFMCSGSIINSRYILTAAHCLFEEKTLRKHLLSELYIGVGRTKWNTGLDNVKAEKFFIHEGYVQYMDDPSPHDIALIKLATPLDLGQDKDKVPICLPDSNQAAGDDVKNSFRHCRVAGWGRMRNLVYYPNGTVKYTPPPSDRLMEVALTVSSRGECSDYLRRQRFDGAVRGIDFENTSLCAGAADIRIGGKDACAGDSGGPLVCLRSDGAWVQVGVVSYGLEKCGERNSYGIYEDVSKYLDWINDIVGGDL